jgi:hypothetical protein
MILPGNDSAEVPMRRIERTAFRVHQATSANDSVSLLRVIRVFC